MAKRKLKEPPPTHDVVEMHKNPHLQTPERMAAYETAKEGMSKIKADLEAAGFVVLEISFRVGVP